MANAGVMATLLGIVGAMGFMSLIRVRFVNIAAIMPLLTLGEWG